MHYASQRAVLRGLLADASFVIVSLAFFLLSDDQMSQLGGGRAFVTDSVWRLNMLCHGFFLPLYALFVYGSAADGGERRTTSSRGCWVGGVLGCSLGLDRAPRQRRQISRCVHCFCSQRGHHVQVLPHTRL